MINFTTMYRSKTLESIWYLFSICIRAGGVELGDYK
jgi:hypothetical protein